MARHGLSQKQIIEAITSLQTEGKDLTVTAIRDRLGGTGSFSTISSVLGQWKHQAKCQENQVPEVPASVSQLLHPLWAEAFRSARNHYEPEKQALLREQEEHATVKKELTSEISRLEGELEEALRREESSRQALEKCHQESRAAESKLQTDLQTCRVEVAKKSSALDLLHEEVKRLRASNEELPHWVERAARAEAALAQAEQKKPRK